MLVTRCSCVLSFVRGRFPVSVIITVAPVQLPIPLLVAVGTVHTITLLFLVPFIWVRERRSAIGRY